MAVIVAQRQIGLDLFSMTLSGIPTGQAGQFVMLYPPDGTQMLLPRPISLFDVDPATGQSTVVYRVVGRGTKAFSTMRAGETLRVTGPFGNGFPILAGDTVLIGGGLGIAPLYLLAKTLKAADPARKIRVYLGYSDETFLADDFAQLTGTPKIDIGGYVTDCVDFSQNATYYVCGPTPMMRAAASKAKQAERTLYVSLENHMACGVGACYACSVKTASGNRRVCKDGPVFEAAEVFYE